LIGGCGAIINGGENASSGTAASSARPTVTVTVTAAGTPLTITVTQTATATVTAEAPAAAPPAAPADTIDGSGTYVVGDDIQPGTYKTAGPGSLGMCYWERDKDSSGDFGAIIANDNLTGQGVVTVKKTDKVFKTQGCQDWVKSG
jgi:hypothetical protein